MLLNAQFAQRFDDRLNAQRQPQAGGADIVGVRQRLVQGDFTVIDPVVIAGLPYIAITCSKTERTVIKQGSSV